MPRLHKFLSLFSLLFWLACLGILLSSPQNLHAQDDEEASQKAIVLFNRGQDAHEKSDIAGAIRFYNNALEIFPEFPEAELQRGNAYLSLNRIDDAEKSYRRAVELREDWSLALAGLGSVLVTKSLFAEAEPILARAISLDNSNFPALSALAELRLKTNASDNVLRELLFTLKALSEKAKPTAAIWSARAALEYKLGDRAQAKNSAGKALSIDQNNKTAIALSADIAFDENDPAQADLFIRRYETLSPKSETALLLKARLLIAQDKSKDALALLEPAASTSKPISDLIGRIKTASTVDLAELESKLQQNPKDVLALGKLCSGFRVENPSKALDYCRRASEAEPDNVNHATGYGAALVQAKRYEEAVALLGRISSIVPDNATVRANLATALFQLKRFAEAKIQYQWLTAKQPTLAGAFYFLAITHDRLGEYLDAMANYQQFLRLADQESGKLEIDKVNLRLPSLQKQIKDGKGSKKN